MNIAKVLRLSLLTIMGSSLVGGAAFAEQTWPSDFLVEATTILGYLSAASKMDPTGVRISYAARCDVNRAPLIPRVRLQKAFRSNTMFEAARSVFRSEDDAVVSSGKLGNVGINIANAPDALLRTNIPALRLTQIEQYNPLDAIPAIVATKEVEKRMAAR